jgi:hypothetical protein
MPSLVSKGSDAAQFDLKPGINRIGRNSSNTFQVHDKSISGTHCEIIVEGDSVRVRDLDSTNGTFVDDVRISESVLHEGQTLRLGSCTFCFVSDASRVPTTIRLSRPTPTSVPQEIVPLPPVAPGVNTCANHETRGASFVCKKCGGHFCDSCVNEQIVDRRKLRFCRACGEECVSLREPGPKFKPPETFFQMLPRAFAYPLKRDGLIMLVSGTIFFGFLDAIINAPHGGGFFAVPALVTVQLFALGYLVAYMKAIVAVSAYGDENMPKWPDFGEFYDDILHPIMLMAGCLLLCFAPVLVYIFYIDFTLPGWEQLGFIGLMILGCAALPICMLAAFLHETVLALNPLVLFITVLRVPAEYLVACVVLGMLVGLRCLSSYIAEWAHVIPVLPQVVDGFISLYLLSVEMRVIGLIFHTKRKQLGWAMS